MHPFSRITEGKPHQTRKDNAMNHSSTAQENTFSVSTNNTVFSAVKVSAEKTKPKKHRKTRHCRENHKDRQLIVTKATSIPGTEAFNELMEKRKLYPDYTIIYRTAKPSENRLSVKMLDVENMRRFIELSYPDDDRRLKEFDLQSHLSELYPSPITYLRNWFRRNHREYWDGAKKAENA